MYGPLLYNAWDNNSGNNNNTCQIFLPQYISLEVYSFYCASVGDGEQTSTLIFPPSMISVVMVVHSLRTFCYIPPVLYFNQLKKR